MWWNEASKFKCLFILSLKRWHNNGRFTMQLYTVAVVLPFNKYAFSPWSRARWGWGWNLVRAFQEKLNIIAMLSLSLCSLVNQNWPRERSFVYMMRAGHKERAASKQERCVRAAISGRFGASRAGRVRRDRAGAEKFGIRTALYLFGVLRHRSNARRKLDAQQRFESGQRLISLSWPVRDARAEQPPCTRGAICPARAPLSTQWHGQHLALVRPTGFATDHLVFDALIIHLRGRAARSQHTLIAFVSFPPPFVELFRQ